MDYLVLDGEYPFDVVLGLVQADTAEQALQQAKQEHGGHPVVECLGEVKVFND